MSPNVERTPNTSDWKTHPFYFVAIGFGLGVAFAMTWLAPAQIGNLRYEVEDARRSAGEVMDYKQKIANLEKQLEESKELTREARAVGLFDRGSPYPVGFGKVRVGDPVALVEQNYSNWLTDKEEQSWTIKPNDDRIRAIVYFFKSTDKNKVITHISIDFDGMDIDEQKKFITGTFAEILGPPIGRMDDHNFEWKAPSGEHVYSGLLLGYLIMDNQYEPNWWHKMDKESSSSSRKN